MELSLSFHLTKIPSITIDFVLEKDTPSMKPRIPSAEHGFFGAENECIKGPGKKISVVLIFSRSSEVLS